MNITTEPNVSRLESNNDINELINALNYKENKEVRQKAANALVRIGVPVIGPLINALNVDDSDMRYNVSSVLGYCGDIRAVKALIHTLEDRDENVQDMAATALIRLGKIAVEPLIEALKSPNKDVQGYAASILGEIQDKSAVEPLIKVLKSPYDYDIDPHPNNPEYDVQVITAISLEKIGDPRAQKPLEMALKDPKLNLHHKMQNTHKNIQSREYKPQEKPKKPKGLLEGLLDLGVDLTVKAGKFARDMVINPVDKIEIAEEALRKKQITKRQFQDKKTRYIQNLKNRPFNPVDTIKKAKNLLDKNTITKEEYEEIRKISLDKIVNRNVKLLDPEKELKLLKELKDINIISRNEYLIAIKPYKEELMSIKMKKEKEKERRIKREKEKLKEEREKKFKNLPASEKIRILENKNDVQALVWILEPETRGKVKERYGKYFFDSGTKVWYEREAIEALGRIADESVIPKLKRKIYGSISKRSDEYQFRHSALIVTPAKEAIKKIEDRSPRIVKQRKRDYHLVKIKLIDSGDIILIENFAKNYSKKYDESTLGELLSKGFSNEEEYLYDIYPICREIQKLRDLLIYKDYEVNSRIFKSLILESYKTIKYETLKKQVLYNSPETLKQILLNYIEFYGNNYMKSIDELYTLIKNEGYKTSKNEIINKLNKINEEKKFAAYEKSLLDIDSTKLTINDIDKLSGNQFERYAKLLFEKMGYETRLTKNSGDQGADIILKKFGQLKVVQTKRYSNKISNKAIQEAVASIKYYNANSGMVLTNNEFTTSAIKLASANEIELIDRHKLTKLISKYPITENEIQ